MTGTPNRLIGRLRRSRPRRFRALLVAPIVAALASCGDLARNDRSPVILQIATLQAAPGDSPTKFGGSLGSSVLTLITNPPPCAPASPCPTIFSDAGQVVLTMSLKNIGEPGSPASPSTNNQVTINRFHVKYVRADGQNVQGVDVPYEWDGAVTGTVPIAGTLTLSFVIVRHDAKMEAPLVQLQFNNKIITTIAYVTFYGHDQVGNEVSVTGSIQIDFGFFAHSA